MCLVGDEVARVLKVVQTGCLVNINEALGSFKN